MMGMEMVLKDIFSWQVSLTAKLFILGSFVALVVYISNLILNKTSRPQLLRIKPAVIMSATVVIWYFFVITRALYITHFHLFVAVAINIVYAIGELIGLVWLIRRPSVEPLILLSVFNALSLILHSFLLVSLSLEHELSMIIVAVCLKSIALYCLIRAIPKMKHFVEHD